MDNEIKNKDLDVQPKSEKETSEKKATRAPAKKTIRVKDIDPDQYVTVKNGFQGVLVYVSKRSGEVFEWEDFGDEQEMSLSELKNARNSSKSFFQNNWFMFDEPWVIEYLGVGKFYEHSIPLDDFDELFTKNADDVKKALEDMPEGQKRSVAYRARQMIIDRKIDSLNTIAALEEGLGIELTEH